MSLIPTTLRGDPWYVFVYWGEGTLPMGVDIDILVHSSMTIFYNEIDEWGYSYLIEE